MSATPTGETRSPKEFESALRSLVGSGDDDAALRTALERLAGDPLFAGSTALWGPTLYRRNRVLFRPFILAHFATWRTDGRRLWERVPWEGAAADLDAWLQEVDRRDDVELFRKLYSWKHANGRWGGLDEVAWRADLLARFRGAKTLHERNNVLAKFDLGATLDEPTAIALDATDPVAVRAFLLRHLAPRWSWDAARRRLWGGLFAQVLQRGDEDLAYALYRKQVALKTWKAEVARLCGEVGDPETLDRELEKRHPEGWGLDRGDALLGAVSRRGRDVLPYVLRHIRDVWGGYQARGSFEPLLARAEREGWLELWSGLLRVAASDDRIDREVARLADDRSLGDDAVRRRLALLSGASRERNSLRFGLARAYALKDRTAIALYARFPDLVRGPFRMHVAPNGWGEPYAGLAEDALAAGDEVLVDFLASRAVTRGDWNWPGTKALIALAERLSVYYEGLRAADPREFARRATSVLGQVPAYAIASYDKVARTNRLARLLYERSSASFLDDPRSLRDLLEAPEIHAQMLALRALGRDDDRARRLAAENLDLLLATPLRPLHRRTRLLAFEALFNAAGTTEDARRVLDRARQSLDLPDRRYPKEALVGLIGRLLHARPELRGPRERPVVYGEVAP